MFTLNCKGRLLEIKEPLVMGILNLTPDSFYPGSRLNDLPAVLAKAEQMLNEGAGILDLGGQSTRPGATRITAQEEMARIMGPLKSIREKFPRAFISVDTFYSAVAREAVANGADIINDISGGSFDANMIDTVAELRVPYVLMHIKGDPLSMQSQADYKNVTIEVLDHLSRKMKELTTKGIHDIIIDPGFGFAKTIAQNFQLLRELEAFGIIKAPLLLGLSRKSTVYKTLGIEPGQALNGSIVLQTIGLMKGANIIRTHDVKETAEAIKLVTTLQKK